MMEYGISLALVASALGEVTHNRDLIKLSAATDAAELDMFEYLHEHLDNCHKRSTDMLGAWYDGFSKRAGAANAEGLLKQALFGIDMHPAADAALTFGAYMTPGLGTGMMTVDAVKNFNKMVGKGLNWKQRLGHGLMGLLDTGFAGISLFPGLGAIGATAKGGKLATLLAKLGKPGTAIVKGLSKGIGISRGGIKAVRTAAKSKGLRGTLMRTLGFGSAYKTGKIRNFARSVGRKLPWVGKSKMLKPVTYNNPFTRLGQFDSMLAQYQHLSPQKLRKLRKLQKFNISKGIKDNSGLKSVRDYLGAAPQSPLFSAASVDNPAWRRLILGSVPATMGASALASSGSGSPRVTDRLPAMAARQGKRVYPLLRRSRVGL